MNAQIWDGEKVWSSQELEICSDPEDRKKPKVYLEIDKVGLFELSTIVP